MSLGNYVYSEYNFNRCYDWTRGDWKHKTIKFRITEQEDKEYSIVLYISSKESVSDMFKEIYQTLCPTNVIYFEILKIK